MSEPLRAVLYLRQSTYREESISLELQETAGREYCRQQGYTVVSVESDPGISGRTWNRPAVQRVMEMVANRDAEVIVLWKWSRLSRSRLDWAVAADKVEQVGGRIESATEPLDVSTSTGRLARGMLTEFAAFESERIGDVWKESHARRFHNGLPINGKPRFGYVYDRATGFSPDPTTAPVLADAYRRYISGESVYSLVQVLNAGPTRPVEGYGPKGDGLWSDRTVRRVMDSGFAAGYITHKGERVKGVHPALITEAQWTAYQEARQRRSVYRRGERSEYLLSGLVWCSCGSKMNAGLFGSKPSGKFRCKAAHDKRTHAGGYVSESLLNDAVFEWLSERSEEPSKRLPVTMRAKPAVDPTLSIQKRIGKLDNSLEVLVTRLVDGSVPHATYLSLRDKMITERDQLSRNLLSAQVRTTTPPKVVLPSLMERWGDLPIPQKRELVRAIISQIVVTTGRPSASIQVIGWE